MYLKYITCLFFCLVLLAACHTSRKSLSSAGNEEATKKETPAPSEHRTYNVLSDMSLFDPPSGKPAGLLNIPAEVAGVPGDKQLESIREKYAGITLETLRLGHALFNGACTDCHAPKSIYARSEERWHLIIDEMAPLAKLSQPEKDAVLQYVVSVKATQPKD